jgi:GTPase KRas protein
MDRERQVSACGYCYISRLYGNTSLTLVQFIGYPFFHGAQYHPTIEDTYRKQIVVHDKPCIVELQDIAQQVNLFGDNFSLHVRNADAVIILYGVCGLSWRQTERLSAVRRFYRDVERAAKENQMREFPVGIVGTQCDTECRRVVAEKEARKTAKTLGCRVLEWSAKEGDGDVLDGLVSDIVGDIMRQREKGASSKGNNATE